MDCFVGGIQHLAHHNARGQRGIHGLGENGAQRPDGVVGRIHRLRDAGDLIAHLVNDAHAVDGLAGCEGEHGLDAGLHIVLRRIKLDQLGRIGFLQAQQAQAAVHHAGGNPPGAAQDAGSVLGNQEIAAGQQDTAQQQQAEQHPGPAARRQVVVVIVIIVIHRLAHGLRVAPGQIVVVFLIDLRRRLARAGLGGVIAVQGHGRLFLLREAGVLRLLRRRAFRLHMAVSAAPARLLRLMII